MPVRVRPGSSGGSTRGDRGGVMSVIFISHVRRDREVARSVADALAEAGHAPYLDESTSVDADWWRDNLQAVEECDLLLALESPAYAGSEACRAEVRRAEAARVPVLRVPLGDEDPAEWVVALLGGAAVAEEEPWVEDELADEVADEGEWEEWEPEEEWAEEPEEDSQEEPRAAEPVLEPEPLAEPAPRAIGLEVMVAVGLCLLLVAVLLGLTWLTGDRSAPGTTTPERDRGATAAQGTDGSDRLVELVAAAGSGGATAVLPASSCGRDQSRLVCRHPVSNVRTVTLRRYDGDHALREAYTREVQRISGATYRADQGDCDGTEAYGESAWSDPGTPGASGRAFCLVSSQVMSLVWTDGDGLLGTVTGQPAAVVNAWWAEARTQLASAGTS
jgi:hypothetical protein